MIKVEVVCWGLLIERNDRFGEFCGCKDLWEFLLNSEMFAEKIPYLTCVNLFCKGGG